MISTIYNNLTRYSIWTSTFRFIQFFKKRQHLITISGDEFGIFLFKGRRYLNSWKLFKSLSKDSETKYKEAWERVHFFSRHEPDTTWNSVHFYQRSQHKSTTLFSFFLTDLKTDNPFWGLKQWMVVIGNGNFYPWQNRLLIYPFMLRIAVNNGRVRKISRDLNQNLAHSQTLTSFLKIIA